MVLNIPDELLKQSHLTERDFQIEIACRMFDAGKFTLRQAGKFAALERLDMEEELRQRNVRSIDPPSRISNPISAPWKNSGAPVAIIVSDTSPIRALAHLDLLHLLHAMFGEVIVPPKVGDELEHPRPPFAAVPVGNRIGFKVIAPNDTAAVNQLMELVDQGEAEAIALAGELHAELLLIDEMTGRKVAQSRGLEITGVIGILLRAKREGRIGQIKTLLERLESELRFFMAPAFKTETLRSAGE